jgi:transcriptional regulator with XRE-family HTH domain
VTSPKAFGDTLRRQREKRGIALETIAEQTKIGSAFLVALERGDCSKWPGGIYSRAWIKAYAEAIGLDGDEVTTEFARWFSRNAFPEGEPPLPSLRLAEVPRAAPLRLGLDPDPQERLRIVTRRALLLALDVVFALIVATGTTLLTTVTFWMAFTLAIIACHAIGLFGGGGSAAGWIDRSLRKHARPHDEANGESAVAEAI